jgi:hypothetical protein
MTPSEVDACQPFTLWFDGSCLGARFGQQQVSLMDSTGGQILGKIAQLRANTAIGVEFPALEPGQYLVLVTFCGEASSGATLLRVVEKASDIKKFSAVPSHIALCFGAGCKSAEPTSVTSHWD